MLREPLGLVASFYTFHRAGHEQLRPMITPIYKKLLKAGFREGTPPCESHAPTARGGPELACWPRPSAELWGPRQLSP